MKVSEMPMAGPDFSKQAREFGESYSARWREHGKHIGDIEGYSLLQDGIYYSLWDGEKLIAYCSLSNADNTVDDVWVNPEYRGKKLFSMLLWFFKTRLGRSRLMLGKIHSGMMREVVKGLSRFNKSWYNIRTNETAPFDGGKLDDYYSYLGPTPWRLILENDGEFNWPGFGGGYVVESYRPYIG